MFVSSFEHYFHVFNSIIYFGRKDQLIHVSGPSDSQTVSGLQPGFMVKFESTKALDYAWLVDITVINFSIFHSNSYFYLHSNSNFYISLNIEKAFHEC